MRKIVQEIGLALESDEPANVKKTLGRLQVRLSLVVFSGYQRIPLHASEMANFPNNNRHRVIRRGGLCSGYGA
jgi:hypothetical protein